MATPLDEIRGERNDKGQFAATSWPAPRVSNPNLLAEELASFNAAQEPPYAISKPKRIQIGHGPSREVWFEVAMSDGRANASETLGSAMRFYREHQRPS